MLIEHRGILRLLDPINPYAVSSGDRLLQLAPLAFDAATFEIWGSLLKGATLVLAPPGQLTLQELAALLRQQRVSTLWLTAGLFQAMVEEQPDALAAYARSLPVGMCWRPAQCNGSWISSRRVTGWSMVTAPPKTPPSPAAIP